MCITTLIENIDEQIYLNFLEKVKNTGKSRREILENIIKQFNTEQTIKNIMTWKMNKKEEDYPEIKAKDVPHCYIIKRDRRLTRCAENEVTCNIYQQCGFKNLHKIWYSN